MVWIKKNVHLIDKLSILSNDSQYDLACACGQSQVDRRHRSVDNKWIYPVAISHMRERTYLFKTLLSNKCENDCKYCPLRSKQNIKRCSMSPEEIVNIFLSYYRAKRVMGLFLSSGVISSPDTTMALINKTAAILRQKGFKGYVHLKIIPGASNAAIEESLSLASAVSLNVETVGEKRFRKICSSKNYETDIVRPIKFIGEKTARGTSFSNVKKTTQFIIGASDETDREIIKCMWGLYKRVGLNRVYFSAYQRGLGEPDLPGEIASYSNDALLTREHRLYQVDWLIRQYHFQIDEIPFEADGNISLTMDPKEAWAIKHPEFFPINVNKADKEALLRVPGIGTVTVNKIMSYRKNNTSLKSVGDLLSPGKQMEKVSQYIIFS